MRMATVFTVLVIGLAVYGSYKLVNRMTSIDDWVQVEARFVESRIEEEIQWDGDGDVHTGEYVVTVTYEYTDPFDHVMKRSENMLAGGKVSFLNVELRPPFTLRKAAAETFVEDLRQRGSFPVYINPREPSDTGIVRLQDALPGHSRTTIWIVGSVLAALVLSLVFGVYWIVEYRPDIVDGYVEKVRHWLDA
jgi:hypothetical protein